MSVTASSFFPYLFSIVVLVLGSVCFYLPSLLLLAFFFIRPPIRSGSFHVGGDGAAQRSSNLNEGESSVSFLSGGRSDFAVIKREMDFIDEQIRRNSKTVADVYPANKITVRCKKCHNPIGAGQGYMHYQVGTRGTFCRDCHIGQGLPLRDEDDVEKESSVIMDGEGVDAEV